MFKSSDKTQKTCCPVGCCGTYATEHVDGPEYKCIMHSLSHDSLHE